MDSRIETIGDLVHLLILETFGFLGGLGQRVERLDFLHDSGRKLVNFGSVGLGKFFVGHQRVGGAFGDGVFKKRVDGLDLAAGLLGGGLKLGGVLLLKITDLALASVIEVWNDLEVNVAGVAAED